MTDIAKIAEGLSSAAKSGITQGAGCDCGVELVKAGLWEPEFPPDKYPDIRQEYFKITPLGLQVRAHLLANRETPNAE